MRPLYPDGEVGLPPTVDGDPLPDDEPAVEPGERPSDGPPADEWRDPPAPHSDACCDVGEIVHLDDIDRQASVPVVAWSGGRWGVAFADQPAPPDWSGPSLQTVFRHVDITGRPIGGLRVLDGFDVRPVDLAWGNHRYALLTYGLLGGSGPALLAALDSSGAPRSVVSIPESNAGATVERYPLVHGWAVATYFNDSGGASGLSRLLLFDESLSRLPEERDLGRTLHADWRAISIVPLKSRLAVVQGTESGIVTRAFYGTSVTEDRRVRATIWPGTYLENRGSREEPLEEQVASAVSATRLRDSVMVAYMNRTHLATVVVDPFGEAPPSEPQTVAPSPAHRNPGMGGDDVTGTVGICFSDGDGPIGGPSMVNADEIRFAVVGPDGRPVGEPVTIASELEYVASCDVATAGSGEWFVVWWNAGRSERRNSISGVRVVLRMP